MLSVLMLSAIHEALVCVHLYRQTREKKPSDTGGAILIRIQRFECDNVNHGAANHHNLIDSSPAGEFPVRFHLCKTGPEQNRRQHSDPDGSIWVRIQVYGCHSVIHSTLM